MSILDQDIALIGAVRPFTLVDREALRLVAFAADRRRLKAGEILFRRGDPSNGAAIVSRGAILIETGEGGEPAFVAERGVLIGEMALLVPTRHPAQATASEASEALLISRPLFKRVLEEFPGDAAAIHEAYARDLRALAAQTAQVRRRLDAIG